jgi:hypothetical protein
MLGFVRRSFRALGAETVKGKCNNLYPHKRNPDASGNEAQKKVMGKGAIKWERPDSNKDEGQPHPQQRFQHSLVKGNAPSGRKEIRKREPQRRERQEPVIVRRT